MATYYSNSSDQRDVMPTLYLRDAGRSTYQGSSHPGDMVYLNYSSAGPYSDALAGNSQSHQNNCVDLPVPTGMLSQDSSAGASDSTTSHQGILSNLVAPRIGEQAYGIWRDGRNETLFMHPTSTLPTMQSIGGSMNNTDDLVRQTVTESPQMDFRAQLGILHSANNLQLQRSDISPNAQGLSLSLSTQIPSGIPVPSFQYRNSNTEISFVGSHQSTSGDGGSCRDDNSLSKQSGNVEFSHAYSGRDRAMHVDTSPYGLSGLSGTISNSKYLKAAQQLLDEVVNVRKALRQESDKHQSLQVSTTGREENDDGSKGSSMLPSSRMPVNPQESTDNSSELSAAERQDLQNKMTKLLAMLDEVDRRYKQYYHQMQIVVSSFDVIAGCGAAKPYTALALQTISRHFRCLRDAISSQIKEARKSLGEPDTSSGKGGGLSRLRFVDQQLRQQRALQQIGMIQQHAWRPQRGLPESSVSILRAWLFEHFLHPYPKDSDKIMLARQTGLTRSQVSNWFINARVRLWKPMVEEMYKEEIGDAEMDSNSSSENAPKAKEGVRTSEEREELQESMKAMTHTSQFGDSKPIHISDVEMAATAACFHNVGSGEETDFGNLKSREQTTTSNACSVLQDTIVQSDGSGRFMAYQMAELGRFGNGGVSLTLGLQHCDGGPPISGGQQNLVAVREDEIYGAASGADAADYNCMNLGNQPHRFGSSRLLHDFVA